MHAGLQRFREAYQDPNLALNGWLNVDKPHKEAIARFSAHPEEASLLERFEMLRKRAGLAYTDLGNRDEIYSTLVGDFDKNQTALNARPEKIRTTSLVATRQIGDEIQDPRYDWYRSTMGEIRAVAYGNPRDPLGFLDKGILSKEAIEKDPSLPEDFPPDRLLKRAVLRYPDKPLEYLQSIIVNTDDLLRKPEFTPFTRTPSTIREVVAFNTKDPEAQLQKLLRRASLIAGWEHKKLFDQGEIDYVTFCTSRNPVTFLTDVLKREAELHSSKKYPCFEKTPWVIRYALIYHPDETEDFLARVMVATPALQAQCTRPEMKGRTGLFLKATVYYDENAQQYLDEVLHAYDTAMSLPEFAVFHDQPNSVFHLCEHAPNRYYRKLSNALSLYRQYAGHPNIASHSQGDSMLKRHALLYPNRISEKFGLQAPS